MSNNESFHHPEYSILGPELTSLVVQVGFVEGLHEERLEFSSISDAYQHIFRNNKEYAVLLWNGVPFRLSYTEDIPFIAEDLLEMLEAIQHKKKKHHALFKTVHLDLEIDITTQEDELTLHAAFRRVSGAYQDAYVPLSLLKISRNAFLSEWKMLLSQYVEAMKVSGSKLRSISANNTMRRLMQLEQQIPHSGRLYHRE
ncbi:MAG: hypothetical protein AAF466_02205 [Bacteroidota bacterium]